MSPLLLITGSQNIISVTNHKNTKVSACHWGGADLIQTEPPPSGWLSYPQIKTSKMKKYENSTNDDSTDVTIVRKVAHTRLLSHSQVLEKKEEEKSVSLLLGEGRI